MEIEWASFGRAFLFLGIGFLLMVFYLQWHWANTCKNNVRLLIIKKSGGGEWGLAPKEGGEVTINNQDTGMSYTWPVNELATADILYPGVGFIPAFMQKSIRLVIVNEGDWEPMLNRSPHRQKIASPDVIEFMLAISKKYPALKTVIENYTGELSTGPTREMIADPAVLGNLKQTQVLKALASVGNDLMDVLRNINTKLSRFITINPLVVYIGLGLIVILVGFLAIKVMGMSGLEDKIDQISNALGIVPPTPTAVPK